jgi:hypothetical protein
MKRFCQISLSSDSQVGTQVCAAHKLIVGTSATKPSSDFIAFLGRLDAIYGLCPGCHDKPVVLVLDNGPIHISRTSRAALAARDWLTIEWLPKYAPELNDIERSWRDLKRHFLAHQTFADTDDLDSAIHRGIANMNQERLFRRGGPYVLRITTLSRDFEMRSPVRFSISSAKRGSVQFGRSDTPGANSASITDKAACALTGAGPGALRARSPDTPSRPKIQRQWRTLSGWTQNAPGIRSLVHPSSDSRMARARSASSRSHDPAKSRSSARCLAVATIHDRPDGTFPISASIC